MLIIRYLILYTLRICTLTELTAANQPFVIGEHANERIKRRFRGPFAKSRTIDDDVKLRSDRKAAPDSTTRASTANKKEQNTPRGYTQENVASVQRILKRNPDDYYGILGLSRSATPGEIEKAWLKLSLRVHPDKNAAPGATEAMQRLTQARDELLKRQSNQNPSDGDQRSEDSHAGPTPASDASGHASSSSSASSDSPSAKGKKKVPRKSGISASILWIPALLLVGVLVFVVIGRKRPDASTALNNGHTSEGVQAARGSDGWDLGDADSEMHS